MCNRVVRNLERFFFQTPYVYCLFQFLKAVITPEFLLILDYRNLSLEHWLLNELASQLAGEGQLVTYSLPFEFRAIEAILQYWVSYLFFFKCLGSSCYMVKGHLHAHTFKCILHFLFFCFDPCCFSSYSVVCVCFHSLSNKVLLDMMASPSFG